MTVPTNNEEAEALANVLEAVGTDWESRTEQGLPTKPLADELADAALAHLAARRPPVSGDNADNISRPSADADAQEVIQLRRIWRAMGCAPSMDDFKPSVRAAMWDQIEEWTKEYASGDSRLYRENRELRAALAASPREVEVTGRDALEKTIMEALDSLWAFDGRVLGKLHVRDEILAALGGGE